MSLVRKGLNLRKKLLWEALAAFLRTLPQMNCILKLYFKNMQSTLMAAWSILKPTPSLLCTVPPGHAQVTIVFKGKFRVSLSHQDRSDRTGASAFSSWRRQLGWSGSQLRSISVLELCSISIPGADPESDRIGESCSVSAVIHSVCNESCAQGGQDVWCHWTGHTVAAFSSHLMWWVIEICIILGMLLVTSILLCARTGFIHF